MHVISKSATTPQDVSAPNGNHYLISDYVGSVSQRSSGPQGFMVEFQTPHGVIPPHFHLVDQFQVVVGGSGKLGKHALAPVSVHYADAFTPYGPISAGPDGLSFFTLRVEGDLGSQYMPGSRDKMERKAGRNLSGHVVMDGTGTVAAGNVADFRPLLGPFDDGVAAFSAQLQPGDVVKGIDAAPGGGQYYVVLEGSLLHEEQQLPRLSCLFVAAGEQAPCLKSGPGGVHLLALQFASRPRALQQPAASLKASE